MPRTASRIRKELLLALSLVGFGLLALPAAVYWVGLQVVGEYEAEGGLWALMLNLWSDVVGANPMALILVLSPYFIIQLLRFARLAWRRK